jgi:hypothetical protein
MDKALNALLWALAEQWPHLEAIEWPLSTLLALAGSHPLAATVCSRVIAQGAGLSFVHFRCGSATLCDSIQQCWFGSATWCEGVSYCGVT